MDREFGDALFTIIGLGCFAVVLLLALVGGLGGLVFKFGFWAGAGAGALVAVVLILAALAAFRLGWL